MCVCVCMHVSMRVCVCVRAYVITLKDPFILLVIILTLIVQLSMGDLNSVLEWDISYVLGRS